MGRRVIDLVHTDPELELVGAVTHRTHAALGRDAGEVAGIGPIGVVLEHDCTRMLSQAHVIIDFSVADAALAYIRMAAYNTKDIVVGTTGFTVSIYEVISCFCKKMECF